MEIVASRDANEPRAHPVAEDPDSDRSPPLRTINENTPRVRQTGAVRSVAARADAVNIFRTNTLSKKSASEARRHRAATIARSWAEGPGQ